MFKDIVKELDPLFNPKSVAHIGATNNWNKWGNSTITSLVQSFKGDIYPVNLHEDYIHGLKVFKKVTDIPGPVDMVVFTIPAERVAAAMEECVQKGVKAATIISAGFAETGARGKELQDEVLAIAQKGNIRFIGPNCMGFWSASASLAAYMMPLLIKEGPIAFVSQGGNVGAAVTVAGYERGVGFRRYVSCGCAADIQIEDYIEYFGKDPEVKVIMTYIEGLNNGKRFTEVVEEVTRTKPVIILKPGKTEAAAKAIRSHSGAMAGTDEVYDAAFKKVGAVRVETPEEMLDVGIGFLTQPLPKGRNVAIITPGGSYGVLCAEACEKDGLNVVKLPDQTIEDLDKIFPPRWSRQNPVDPAGDRNIIAYLTAPMSLLKLPDVDSLIFMGFSAFTLFGSLIFQQQEKTMQYQQQDTERDAVLKAIIPILEGVRSQDVQRRNMSIRQFVTGLGMTLGVRSNIEIDQMTELIESARDSGQIHDDLLDDFLDLAKGEMLFTGNKTKHQYINDLLVRFTNALVGQWILMYKKPVITTTFTEQQVKMVENHYDYGSGNRAVKVVLMLLEYYEYLARIGRV